MLEWAKYNREVGARVGDLGKDVPPVLKAFVDLENAVNQSVHLDAKTRELISLAVAVTTRCDGCIGAHVQAALKAGASRVEISEALSVAISLNAGAALVYSARVLDCYDELSKS